MEYDVDDGTQPLSTICQNGATFQVYICSMMTAMMMLTTLIAMMMKMVMN